MDSFEYSVILIDLDAGNSETSHFCNSPEPFTYGSVAYQSAPSLSIGDIRLTGDFTSPEHKIANLPTSLDIVSGLSENLPYPKVSVTIREGIYDLDDIETANEYLFRAFVYLC